MNHGARRRRRFVVAWIIASLLGAACERTEPVPWPDLGSAEPAVVEQLDRARDELERSLDTGRDDEQQAEAFGRLGMHYHAYGLREAALACYTNAARRAPEDARWPALRGRLELEAGRLEEAADSLMRALELGADPVATRYWLGTVALDDGDAAGAARWFDEAMAESPDVPAVLTGAGRAALALDDPGRARDLLERSARLDRSPETAYLLGTAYRALGDLDRARVWMRTPGEGNAWLDDPLMDEVNALAIGLTATEARARHRAARGDFDRAAALVQEAIERHPEEVRLWSALGEYRLQAGRIDAAAAALRQAIERDPDYAPAHYNLGVLTVQTDGDADALPHYRRALELDPGMHRAWANLGRSLRRLGRYEEALDALREAGERDPTDDRTALLEALTLARLGRWRESRTALERGLRIAPRDPLLLEALLRVLAAAPDERARDVALAQGLMDRLPDEKPTPDLAAAIAMVRAAAGDFETAVRIQRALVEAARDAAPESLRRELERNLTLYRARRPCREPWASDGPVLSPRR